MATPTTARLPMDDFARHELHPRGLIDHKPPPRTWDYLDPGPRAFLNNLALATCANGHTCRIVANVHSINHDGTLKPSYVCPYKCSYHTMVRFVGWAPS